MQTSIKRLYLPFNTKIIYNSLFLFGILSIGNFVQAATDCASVTEIPAVECTTLVNFYNNTSGWSQSYNWNQDNTPCSWEGVKCEAGNVISLNLANAPLSGSIPSELSNLSKLQTLDLRGSLWGLARLTGSIPSSLGNLVDLQELNLSFNELTGAIPPEFGNLTNLQKLILSSNKLSSSIPTELSNLVNLQLLQLNHNELTGSIPTELGNLIQLKILFLQYNKLSNSIPTNLGNLTKLETLYLDHNLLTGSIPSELGNLSILKDLDLQFNQLNGSIPNELSNLSQLDTLFLSNNLLTGVIPTGLSTASSLNLQVENNQLTFESAVNCDEQTDVPVTECVALVALYNNTSNWLSNFDYYSSWSELTEPCSWKGISCQNGHITALNLDNLHLTGSIPNEIGDLTQLQSLILSGSILTNDKLTGFIPAQLGNLTQLQHLDLSYNNFDGYIPKELGNLTALKILNLSLNNLNGSIPIELIKLSNLQELYLPGNQLSGIIPTEFNQLNNLQQLNLVGNYSTLCAADGVVDFLGKFSTPNNISACSSLNQGSLPPSVCISGLPISCNAGGGTINETLVGQNIQLSNATIQGQLTNKGRVSNITISNNGSISGGIASGYVKVAGHFTDFDFLGNTVTGINENGDIVGTIGGNITNNSQISGCIENILLAANTFIYGGCLKGEITGDVDEPAFLENVIIKKETILDNVILGKEVELHPDAILKSVQQFSQASIIDVSGNITHDISNNYTLNYVRSQTTKHYDGDTISQAEAVALEIKLQLFPQLEDIEKEAHVVTGVILKNLNGLTSTFQQQADGSWIEWDGIFNNLQAGKQVSLTENMDIPIYEGSLETLTGEEISVFVGYRLVDEQIMILNIKNPIHFFIE